jgi:heme exporter protein C
MTAGNGVRNLSLVTGAAMIAGLGGIFFWVPTEDFQGVVQRIFYIHVPSAWVAYLAFAVVLVGSIAYLKGDSERWDLLAHASAEVGVVFTAITLVTGMLWAKPVWGTYWRWDPRLTLTFVLFLIYLGYLVFRSLAEEGRGGRTAAVIGIAGFVTVPLVHFSVDWWRGQHPGRTVINPEANPQLPWEMLATLLFMVAVFTLLYALLLTFRVRLGRLQARLDREGAG